MIRKIASVNVDNCVACGCCVKVCPKNAITIVSGVFAEVKRDLCIGCQKCKNECPASVIVMGEI